MKQLAKYTIVGGCFFIAGWIVSSQRKTPHTNVDTKIETYYDTVAYRLVTPVDSVVIRYDTVRLPIRKDPSICSGGTETKPDTLFKDSVQVVLPITQKVYEDTTYKAWISGYRPSLDSIYVYPKTTIITNKHYDKKRRWGLGLHVGMGVCDRKASPYVGVGVSYNIIAW